MHLGYVYEYVYRYDDYILFILMNTEIYACIHHRYCTIMHLTIRYI